MAPKRLLSLIALVVAVPICFLVGLTLLDEIPYSAARPPANLKTIDEFHAWMQESILGDGTYTHAGVTYTVMLAPAGRYLSSGPSAYLFDKQGQFVDWTSDMGDFYTEKRHFDLTSGHVKDFKLRNR